jgi:hypothetical protein
MKNDSGLSLVVSIIIVALAAIGGTTTYYFAQKDSISQTPKTTDVVLKETLSKKGVLLGDPEFTLIHVTDRFARAEIKDPQTGESKDTFLVLIKDEWKIVDITSEPVSCEKMEKIGFPAKMISDCLLDFPQAQTVADLLGIDETKLSSAAQFEETFKNSDLSNITLTDLNNVFSDELNKAITEAIETEIIGTIIVGDDPACNCFQITSEGETINVVYDPAETDPNTFTDISTGDTVVVNTDISENDDGEIIFSANDIVEVSPEIENDINGDPIIEEPVINTDNVSENNNSTDSNQTYVNDSSDNNSDDYDVTVFPEPGDVIIPDDLYQNLLDIDNSDIEVEIISDF